MRTKRNTVLILLLAIALFISSCGGGGGGGSTAPGDTTAPTVSNENISCGQAACTVAYNTSENATTVFQYGTTTAYGSQSSTTSNTAHSLTVLSLTAGTTYYYKITATDSASNSGTKEGSFQTAVVEPPPGNNPPTVTASVTPTSGTAGQTTITWSCSASDSDGTVTSLSLTVNGVEKTTTTGAAISYPEVISTAGSYSGVCTGTDDDGAVRSDTSNSVTISNPPVPQRGISGVARNAGESSSLIDTPMTGVQVCVYSGATQVGCETTGTDGAYSISVTGNGTYKVTATKTGYYSFSTVDAYVDNPATHIAVSDAVASFNLWMVKVGTDTSYGTSEQADFMTWFRVRTMSWPSGPNTNTRFYKLTTSPHNNDMNSETAPANWGSTIQQAYTDLEAQVGKPLVNAYVASLSDNKGILWTYCGNGCVPNDDTGHTEWLHYSTEGPADYIQFWLNTDKISAGDFGTVRKVALHEILQSLGGVVKTTNLNYVLSDGSTVTDPALFEYEMVRLHETLPYGWDMRQYSQ